MRRPSGQLLESLCGSDFPTLGVSSGMKVAKQSLHQCKELHMPEISFQPRAQVWQQRLSVHPL